MSVLDVQGYCKSEIFRDEVSDAFENDAIYTNGHGEMKGASSQREFNQVS